MDVGLMPLADTEWERGKCAFKMLSYMAVGRPVVVSPIGANREVLERDEVGLPAVTPDDWHCALRQLFDHPEAAVRMGAAGRAVVEAHYSVRRSAETLAQIFQQVHGSAT